MIVRDQQVPHRAPVFVAAVTFTHSATGSVDQQATIRLFKTNYVGILNLRLNSQMNQSV